MPPLPRAVTLTPADARAEIQRRDRQAELQYRAAMRRNKIKPKNIIINPEAFGLELILLHKTKRGPGGTRQQYDAVAIFKNKGNGNFVYGIECAEEHRLFESWKVHNTNTIVWSDWKNAEVFRWLGYNREKTTKIIAAVKAALIKHGFTDWTPKAANKMAHEQPEIPFGNDEDEDEDMQVIIFEQQTATEQWT